MKLYRAEATNMMMEVYVLKGYIKIQSSNFILHGHTNQTVKEMDAWLMSCNPLAVSGDISNTKEYNFSDYDITLSKLGTDGIHYMISCNSDTNTQGTKTTTNHTMDKQYSNEHFSIKYPTSWQIVQDDNKITNNTSISVQIMEKQKNEYDFRPNINIIVSNKKRTEPVAILSDITISQNRQAFSTYKLLTRNNNVILSNCKGCKLEQQFTIRKYNLRSIQYIVKKKDNTTYTITATMDTNQYSTQVLVLNKIINSLIIK